MAPQNVFIIGAGGLARELRALLRIVRPRSDVEAFVDLEAGASIEGIPVIGETEFLGRAEGAEALLGVGYACVREKIVARIARAGVQVSWPTIVHPSASIDDRASVSLGRGCIIAAGVRLTVSTRVADFCLLNYNATIGHDAVIGSFSVVNPGSNISGSVILEQAVQIGTGAQVLPGLRLGAHAEVGAGAVVTRDVAPRVTVVGVPARPLDKSGPEPG